MQRLHRQFHVFPVDEHGNLDFRGGDDLDVDVFRSKRLEHRRCNPRVRAHADADHRDLGHFGVFDQVVVADDAGGAGVGHRLAGAQHLVDRA